MSLMTEATPLLSTKPLSRYTKIGYGLGHVHNDLCACMWFSYTLGFLKLVIPKNVISGILIMTGQLLDALATPIAGYILDRTTDKKKWHMIGTLVTSSSFPFMYAVCTFCGDDVSFNGFYYAVFISIFQIGWAFVQISHLSLLPVLSQNVSDKSDLTAYRYAASMISNVVLYLIIYSIFHGTATGELSLFTPDDSRRFFGIAVTLTAIGLFTSILFHTITRNGKTSMAHSDNAQTQPQQWSLGDKWELLKISIIYSSSRLFVNVTMEYMILYLNEAVSSNKDTISIIPLIMFITSALSSLLYKSIIRVSNQKITFSVGWVISIVGCVVIFMRTERSDDVNDLIAAATLFGAGSALMLVVSLSFAANIVSTGGTEGYIYSMVTFADKIVNGIAVLCIEYLKCESPDVCTFFYKDVLVYFNSSIVTIGLLFVYFVPLNIASLDDTRTQRLS